MHDLIHLEHVSKTFVVGSRVNRTRKLVRAVDDVSIRVAEGQTLALVGESGSGKTTIARMILKFETPTEGVIRVGGVSLGDIRNRSAVLSFRRDVQMVQQDPTSSLNPRKRIGQIISTPLVVHGMGDKEQRESRVRELLELVELPVTCATKYPHMLSGGEKQRVSIARAIAIEPKVLVLDEPTSALDVSVQSKILDLLERLQRSLDLTYFIVTHDLALVRHFADDVVVLRAGRIEEEGRVDEVMTAPRSEYTRALIRAVPVITSEEAAFQASLKGP